MPFWFSEGSVVCAPSRDRVLSVVLSLSLDGRGGGVANTGGKFVSSPFLCLLYNLVGSEAEIAPVPCTMSVLRHVWLPGCCAV